MKSYAIAPSLKSVNTNALRTLLGGVCNSHVRSHLSTQLWRAHVAYTHGGHARVVAVRVPYRRPCAVLSCRNRSTHTVYAAPIVKR